MIASCNFDISAVSSGSESDGVHHDPQRARRGASRLARPAAQNGRSAEAEIRSILEQAARPEGRLKLGSLLMSIAREAGPLTDTEAESFNELRDKTPAEPIRFE